MSSASHYATLAQRYWTTYLPSQVEQMEDPAAHFEWLGKQVMEQIEAALPDAEEAAVEALPPDAPYQMHVAARDNARRAVTELALKDLIYLPPEPGTEGRRMAGETLVGWETETA